MALCSGSVAEQLLSSVLSLKAQNDSILSQNQALLTQNLALADRVSALESQISSRPSTASDKSQVWICPVCHEVFKHRESFKGHIRRMMFPSERPHCFLDPLSPEHVALLAHPRYGDGPFEDRASNFKSQLYSTVKSNSVSTMSSENSFTAVRSCVTMALQYRRYIL